jgi:pyruvate/2-oxoglutarate dehydrogenase complex dihydrolipoamide dehydrogenase (E3) component
MFTDPPLAHVGLSEGEAERRGVIARVARLSMDSVLGAQATDQREGFMKALVGENDDRILGFTMIGATAGEVMAAVQTESRRAARDERYREDARAEWEMNYGRILGEL